MFHPSVSLSRTLCHPGKAYIMNDDLQLGAKVGQLRSRSRSHLEYNGLICIGRQQSSQLGPVKCMKRKEQRGKDLACFSFCKGWLEN